MISATSLCDGASHSRLSIKPYQGDHFHAPFSFIGRSDNLRHARICHKCFQNEGRPTRVSLFVDQRIDYDVEG